VKGTTEGNKEKKKGDDVKPRALSAICKCGRKGKKREGHTKPWRLSKAGVGIWAEVGLANKCREYFKTRRINLGKERTKLEIEGSEKRRNQRSPYSAQMKTGETEKN